jgi:hypothetical protein
MTEQLEWTPEEMIQREKKAHDYLRKKGVVDWSFDHDFDGIFLRQASPLPAIAMKLKGFNW